jgi:hypothetical protein
MSILTQLKDAAASIMESRAATEVQKQVVLKAEEDVFTPLIPKAIEAGEKANALIDAHSAGVQALDEARGTEPYVNQGRNHLDYSRLEQACREFHTARQTAALLLSVEAAIKRTRAYTGYKRQRELEALQYAIEQGIDLPERLEKDILPRIAVLAGKVAEREKRRNENA